MVGGPKATGSVKGAVVWLLMSVLPLWVPLSKMFCRLTRGSVTNPLNKELSVISVLVF